MKKTIERLLWVFRNPSIGNLVNYKSIEREKVNLKHLTQYRFGTLVAFLVTYINWEGKVNYARFLIVFIIICEHTLTYTYIMILSHLLTSSL